MRSESSRISTATRECLSRCYASSSPLETLAEFMNELRGDPAWSEEELHVFKLDVLRMLIKLNPQSRRMAEKMLPSMVR